MEPLASQPSQAPFPIKVLQSHSCGPQLQPDSTGGLALKTNLPEFLFRSLVKMRPRPSTGETFIKQLVCFPEPHGGASLEGSLSYLEENWGSPLITQPHPWGLLAGLVLLVLPWGQNLQVFSIPGPWDWFSLQPACCMIKSVSQSIGYAGQCIPNGPRESFLDLFVGDKCIPAPVFSQDKELEVGDGAENWVLFNGQQVDPATAGALYSVLPALVQLLKKISMCHQQVWRGFVNMERTTF